ncbi:unnamed protein product [Clavelina lepadiformis]|uniref:Uncharacterized protein n=1 Tax=Clavelina lepadiformis TaxID=159417 RepID=A0ABP0GML8_CLALP
MASQCECALRQPNRKRTCVIVDVAASADQLKVAKQNASQIYEWRLKPVALVFVFAIHYYEKSFVVNIVHFLVSLSSHPGERSVVLLLVGTWKILHLHKVAVSSFLALPALWSLFWVLG